jgi:hypothetical protein
MTPSERRLHNRIRLLTAKLEPSLARAILKDFERIASLMNDAEVARLIESDRLFFDGPLSNPQFDELKHALRKAVENSANAFANDVRTPIRFDILNPSIISAIRRLESRVITNLHQSLQETVKAHVEQGLKDGVHPKTVARTLKKVIPLAANQEKAIANYRAKLESGLSVEGYKLRDKRLRPKTPQEIDKAVEAYRERWLKHNAEANAKSAAMDAQKLGQRLSWEQAIERGTVNPDTLMMRWSTARDERVRPEHKAMEGETVPFNGLFSNGQKIPGESDYNCRCVAIIFTKRLDKVA